MPPQWECTYSADDLSVYPDLCYSDANPKYCTRAYNLLHAAHPLSVAPVIVTLNLTTYMDRA
jgi:hypothetical protein